MPLWSARFWQKDVKSSKSDLRQCSQQILLEKLRSNIHETKTFYLISPEVAKLWFLQSALRIFAFRLCRFPVLMAGSSYSSSFASDSLLCRLSDVWLIRRTGTSKSLSSYCAVETRLDVFLLSLGLAKISTVRNAVFMYAKSNTLNFRIPSDNLNQLVMNLEPIEGIWFHKITSNNAVR